jgi:ssDNA-specific exonuclease RecJ
MRGNVEGNILQKDSENVYYNFGFKKKRLLDSLPNIKHFTRSFKNMITKYNFRFG